MPELMNSPSGLFGLYSAARQPAASASSTLQNQRSPLASLIQTQP
jgi:hypothetical protein